MVDQGHRTISRPGILRSAARDKPCWPFKLAVGAHTLCRTLGIAVGMSVTFSPASAAQKGHAPAQALLGHLLFIGDNQLDQHARGLMWLERAKSGAPDPRDQWILELYQRDFQAASSEDRRAAKATQLTPIKGTSPSILARSSVTSFLQLSVVPKTSAQPPAQ